MIRQVERIFGQTSKNFDEFARQSQISQAEAVKYFIERFRAAKWRKTGILWWNIADGWPQVSDAIVDWYGCKKLAYHYVKRSQAPFCMMFDERKDGTLELVATNDMPTAVSANYSVVDLRTDNCMCSGSVRLEANEIVRLNTIPEKIGSFYLIRWTTPQGDGCNHFTCAIGEGWNYETYKKYMKKAGFFEEFEGF